jgi:hypothetical protein
MPVGWPLKRFEWFRNEQSEWYRGKKPVSFIEKRRAFLFHLEEDDL